MDQYNTLSPEIISKLKAVSDHILTGDDINPDFSRDEMLFFYVENQQKLWKVKEEWEKRKDFGEYTCIVKLF